MNYQFLKTACSAWTKALLLVVICLYQLSASAEKTWVMKYQTADGGTKEIPMSEIGSLVAVDDSYNFSILSTTDSVLAEGVLKVTFEEKCPFGDVNIDGAVDVADIASIISVMAAAGADPVSARTADINGDGAVDVADIATVISVMAEIAKSRSLTKNRSSFFRLKLRSVLGEEQASQNSFVVADKNGNSQLVKSLIFQRNADNKQFSWMTADDAEGYQEERDIKDLQFIARVKDEMVTATAEEVSTMLEELSGTNQADAEGIAAVLNDNPNVEGVSTTDGNNLIVRNKGGKGTILYPMYELGDLLLDDAQEARLSAAFNSSNQKRASSINLGRVAIFNFFPRKNGYYNQNRIVDNMIMDFELNGYTVNYYGAYGTDDQFTLKKLQDVIGFSDDYKAIIIMTHGGLDEEGEPCITTRDKVDKNSITEKDIVYHDKQDDAYYRMIRYREEFADIGNNCIVYIGACDGAPKGGFDLNYNLFPDKNQSCVVTWSGKNKIAQADAYYLFHYMMYYQHSLKEIIEVLPEKDPHDDNSSRIKRNVMQKYFESSSQRIFENDAECMIKCEQGGVIRIDKDKQSGIGIAAGILIPFNASVIIELVDMLGTNHIVLDKMVITDDNRMYDKKLDISGFDFGCYDVQVILESSGKQVKPVKPQPLILSSGFSEMYAAPSYPEELIKRPTIIDSQNQFTEEISVSAGSSKTFAIDGYSGHTFNVVTLDTDVVNVSVSGTTLTVTGVAEGSTYLGVYDEQNRQMAIAEVTVTAGGGDIVAYTTCPDEHHPHWIDLGLPSGTKWACCNQGASKPEDYGGYYTFDEAQAYNPPSLEQIFELLYDDTTSEWTTQNGVDGRKFTGSNGGTVFLPAAGYVFGELEDVGSWGWYWSSAPSDEDSAYALFFDSGGANWGGHCVFPCQMSVRPVR